MTYGGGVDWITVLVFIAAGVAYLHDRLSADPPEPGTTEAAQHAYATGDITHAELVRRLEVTECPETEKIYNAVEPINDVGPKTKYALAEGFDSLAELRNTSQADLEDIHGIGPSTANAVRERFDE